PPRAFADCGWAQAIHRGKDTARCRAYGGTEYSSRSPPPSSPFLLYRHSGARSRRPAKFFGQYFRCPEKFCILAKERKEPIFRHGNDTFWWYNKRQHGKESA